MGRCWSLSPRLVRPRRARPRAALLALLLAPALLSSRAPAQPAAPADSPRQLRDDVRTLEVLNALKLNRAQAQAIIDQLPEIYQQLDAIEAARQAMLAATSEAIVKVEWAALRGERAEAEHTRVVQRELAAYERAVSVAERRVDGAVQSITQRILSREQRALVEPEQAMLERLRLERQARQARMDASREAVTDIGTWVRVADAATYPRRRDERAAALALQSYPGADPQALAPVSRQVAALFDTLRGLNAQQFEQARTGVPARVRQALLTNAPRAVASRYVVTEPEWAALWRNRRTAQMLAQLMQVLPEGATR